MTAPDAIPDAAGRLRDWLEAGHHRTMSWMGEAADRRGSPAALWPDVRSVAMVGLTTAPDADPLAKLERRSHGALAVYATRRDYHEVMKGRLKELGGFMQARSGRAVKVFVDTGPVMEKPLAAAAGLGWVGKHSVLVSREHGSWLLLGAILSAAALPPDEAEPERCGSCTRCLDICPTDAFPAPYRLDARRCIAYLTIEHAGHVPAGLRPAIGNRVFGCDDCLAVCPWNKFAAASRDARMAFRDDLAAPPLADLARLDDAAFRARFAGTPVKRTGRDRFTRNVLLAIGNSGDATLADDAVRLLDDPAAIVRGAAIWAASRLLPPDRVAALAAARRPAETDDDVRAEWDLAVGEPAGLVSPERLVSMSKTQPPLPEVPIGDRPRRTHDGSACFEGCLRQPPQHEEGGSSHSRPSSQDAERESFGSGSEVPA